MSPCQGIELYAELSSIEPSARNLVIGGTGGIRTHAPFRTNGFQDRLVMTTSIPFRILPDKQDLLYRNFSCLSTAFYKKNGCYSRSSHSFSLKPGRAKSSPTSSGRLTSMPSVASSAYCSSSVMAGSLSLSPSALYCRPLVLKNRLSGRPLFSCHARSSCSVGLSCLISRSSNRHAALLQPRLRLSGRSAFGDSYKQHFRCPPPC